MGGLEVFTIGGGEYIVNVFHAVAAWTGGGGYRSMLQVVMVMGFIYSLFGVAFARLMSAAVAARLGQGAGLLMALTSIALGVFWIATA